MAELKVFAAVAFVVWIAQVVCLCAIARRANECHRQIAKQLDAEGGQ
jgi:hypothetical protein